MRTLSSLIVDYLETGEYEKQLSPDTIKAYRIDLQQFVNFTEGVWADKDVLNQYIKYLNQHFAPRSVKRKLASVRDRKSTRLNSSHHCISSMPSSD